ncbi:MAG: 4-hydroxy-tetrahydrodipicolinate synthase, partial [Alphaproteobacteria bacterium]|nr:4-hydroxy-tetrahydrodipicolinate synthase [Alphaproteobacteria bacterium]
FDGDDVDFATFDRLIDAQIAGGTHGLIACGTTGESPTLDHHEHASIVERCVARVKGRIPVIAGTGSNCTKKAVDMTRHAREAGADAALVVTPYYNKPTQDGLIAHYTTIADAVDIPLFIYNIPGRCVVDMTTETMAVLAKHKNIIGVKDATGDLSRVKKIATACGADFIQLSGEDGLIGDYMEQGGHGCIGVTANIAPALCATMHKAWIAGDKDKFHDIARSLLPLHAAMFCETSPAPVKYAAQRLGFGSDAVRLPLVPASAKARATVDQALEQLGLLSGGDGSILRAHG